MNSASIIVVAVIVVGSFFLICFLGFLSMVWIDCDEERQRRHRVQLQIDQMREQAQRERDTGKKLNGRP